MINKDLHYVISIIYFLFLVSLITLYFREILQKDPSPKAYELLGDAYMSIQEPINAIEAYETAMRRSPKDHLLAEKIANAYVKCHLYNKVCFYYI